MKLLNIRSLRLLTALVFSYFLHIANLIPLKYFQAGAHQYSLLVNAEIALLTLYLLWHERSNVRPWLSRIKGTNLNLIKITGSDADTVFDTRLGVSLIAVIVGYLLLVGPYTEVPADAWHHLGEFQQHYVYLQQDQLRPITSIWSMFTSYAGYWYFLHAYIAHVADQTIAESLQPLTIATSVSFLLSVYLFALFLFRDSSISRKEAAIVSALSAGFYAVHFGINIFSYVRYYAFAPTMLNFVVYFSAVGVLIQFLRGGKGADILLALLPIHLIVLAAVHMQEAIFFVIMSTALIMVYFIELRLISVNPNGQEASQKGVGQAVIFTNFTAAHLRVSVLFITGIVLTLFVWIYSYVNLDRHDPLQHGRLISIGDILPFLKNMYILNPVRDFYQVITAWGVFIYVLFLISVKKFRQYPYLMAGMVLPLLTVFNPLFTDFFLRYSWPEVLWRICYLIPLPFVAAFVLLSSFKSVVGDVGMIRKAGSALAIVLALALLFPLHNTYFDSRFSRIYTLGSVERGNDYLIWADLIEFLDKNPVKRVLTDPVSGYVIKGVTTKRYQGHKFHKIDHINLNHKQYDPEIFLPYAHDWLLVVNKRDGELSDNGERARHWPKDVLRVSQYYSDELLQYVSGNPDLFKPVWEQDRITVYQILEPT